MPCSTFMVHDANHFRIASRAFSLARCSTIHHWSMNYWSMNYCSRGPSEAASMKELRLVVPGAAGIASAARTTSAVYGRAVVVIVTVAMLPVVLICIGKNHTLPRSQHKFWLKTQMVVYH